MDHVASLPLRTSFLETFPPYPKGSGPLALAADLAELVIVGPTTRREQRALYNLASRGGEALVFQPNPKELRDYLAQESAEAPRCVVLDLDSPKALSFVTWLRGSYRYCMVPIIGLVSDISSVTFKKAFAAGVDEVVPRNDLLSIIRRAQKVLHAKKTPPVHTTERHALIVTPSVFKRQLLGRVLRVAGFTLAFADTLMEAAKRMAETSIDLVVLHSEEETQNAWALVTEARVLSRNDTPVVLVIPTGTERDERLATPRRTAILAADAPAEDLLFAVNEIMLPLQKRNRASTRLLFGAVCSYRLPELKLENFGFTYNVSSGGLYVRTLDPPPVGSLLLLNVTPPFGDKPVELKVQVMWARPYGANIGGASPVGFGAKILEAETAPNDLAAYLVGYQRLAESMNTPTDDSSWNGPYHFSDKPQGAKPPPLPQPKGPKPPPLPHMRYLTTLKPGDSK